MKKLSDVKTVAKMLSGNNFIIDVDGGTRKVSFGNVKDSLMSALVTPPSIYTLEGSSSPEFDVSSDWAAQVYRSAMGGYMMKVVGGQVYAAKLNPNDWNYFADGSKVDNAAKYETMVHVPPCNFKASGKTMQFGGLSPIAEGHTFDSPEWVGAYLGNISGNALHSRPDVSPSHSNTMSNFFNYAKNNGSEWGLANYGFFCLINALYQASFGNLNCQSVVGAGWQHYNWEACRNVALGLTRKLGDGTGSVLYNDSTLGNQYPTKLFGFEDLWGKLWEFRPGIRFYMKDGQRYAVVYGGNQCSNTATGREVAIPLLNSGGRTAKTMLLDEYWDMLCTSYDANTYGGNTFYCDGHWDAQGGELLFVGGYAADGLRVGVSYSASLGAFSDSGSYVGARLAFYGTPIIVNGSVLMTM